MPPYDRDNNAQHIFISTFHASHIFPKEQQLRIVFILIQFLELHLCLSWIFKITWHPGNQVHLTSRIFLITHCLRPVRWLEKLYENLIHQKIDNDSPRRSRLSPQQQRQSVTSISFLSFCQASTDPQTSGIRMKVQILSQLGFDFDAIETLLGLQ